MGRLTLMRGATLAAGFAVLLLSACTPRPDPRPTSVALVPVPDTVGPLTVWPFPGAEVPYVRPGGWIDRDYGLPLRLEAHLAGARVMLMLPPPSHEAAQVWVSGLPHGSLPVRLVIRDMEGDSVAGTGVTFDIQPEHTYWVTVRAGRNRGTRSMCGIDAAPIPLPPGATATDPAVRDTLFVRHGWGSIHAIC